MTAKDPSTVRRTTPRPTPRTTPIARAAAVAVAALGVFGTAAPAWSFTLTPDATTMTCSYDPNDPDSEVTRFFGKLNRDAQAARLAELDAADPGLAARILDYQAAIARGEFPEDAPDIQAAIAAAGGNEKLGQLLVMDQDPNTPGTPKDQWPKYTAEQARAAAEAITDDPSAEVAQALDSAAATGTGFDAAKARLFHERAGEYNATQQDLKASLTACADELDALAPRPLWHFVLGTLAVLFVAVLLLKATVSRTKPKYAATSHRATKHRASKR